MTTTLPAATTPQQAAPLTVPPFAVVSGAQVQRAL
jgi:hypothetical protein